MNSRERVLNVLSDQPADKIPVTCFTQVGIVEAMQKVGAPWPEAHSDPKKMAVLGASLNRLVGLEAVRIPFCLTVEAEAIGCKVDMGTINRQPSIRAPAFESPSLAEIGMGFLDKGRIPVVLEAIRILKKENIDAPLIVGITGPFTLSGHLVETEKLVKMMRTKPTEVENLLDKVTDASIAYVEKIAEAGADVITVNEPSAAPELIDPLSFRSTIKSRLQYLARNIKTKKVLHICGASLPIVGDMAECGFDAISIEDKVDIAKAREVIKGGAGAKPAGGFRTGGGFGGGFGGPRLGASEPAKAVKIAGNVSTAKTLFTGKPEEVKAEALNALRAGTDLLAPACGIAPGSPLANIKAMIEARDEYQK